MRWLVFSLTIFGFLFTGVGFAEEGFVALFNGKNLDGWQGYTEDGLKVKPEESAFSFRDGMIHSTGERPDYWLVASDRYKDFVLRLEFRPMGHSNSGVFLRVPTPAHPAYEGFEIQILGDHGEPTSKHSCGSIYDVLAPTKNMTRPTGEWNQMEITCKGPLVTVVQNGEKIIESDFSKLTTPIGKFKISYAQLPREGLLGIQSHGGEIWFRNIEIKVLKD
jgi:hypothetical protein